MRKTQIKELVDAIIKYNELSEKDLYWICCNFSRQDLKLFVRLLLREIKSKNVIVSFAGKLSDINRKKILAKFSNKKVLFRRDDHSIIGGIYFEYGDFIFDCSISGVIKRTLDAIRESL